MARKITGKRLLLCFALALAMLHFSHEGLTAEPAMQSDGSGDEPATLWTMENPRVQQVIEVQNRHTDELMSMPGVVGVGTGLDIQGEPAIVVLTMEDAVAASLPAELEGISVVARVSGAITLSGGTNTSNTSTTSRYTRPVPIGVSTSNWNECSAGTMGVRVRNGNNYYVLSCNHVFARMNAATTGEAIVQPGRSDVSCAQNTNDQIGTLADYETLVYSYTASNVMDAAIVSTDTSKVSISTPIDGYGTPSAVTISPSLNLRVQKYGRTTGLTQGEITIVNTAITVTYGVSPTRFVGQIVAEPLKKNNPFADGGDSGSLVVSDDANVNPVGMVFGKSNDMVFLNPIDTILSRFNVQIDDGTPNANPVELVSFSGAMVGADVQLKWHTATELENFGFFVQRSIDREHWTDIDMIPGAGTVNTPRSYRYTDAGIMQKFAGQTLYYRLLQLDRDGTENYSSILTIENRPAPASMQVYPHPVRSNATVQLQLNQPAEGRLHVYDAAGRRLDILTHSLPLVEGTHIVPLSLSSVSPGYYFLEFESAGTVVRKRIMVVR